MIERENIPSSWEVTTLKEVCIVVTDGTHKTPTYVSKGIPFISIANIRAFKPLKFDKYVKYISKEEHMQLCKRAKPELDDILFPRIGTLGYAKRIDFDSEVSIFVGLGLAKPNKNAINPKFLEYYMNTAFVNRYSFENATGTGRLTLPLEASREIPIALPPILEQHRIVDKIEELLTKLENSIEQLTETKNQLEFYEQAIMKWAFEGKLTRKKIAKGELPKGWKLLKLKDVVKEKEGLRRGPFGSAIKKEFFVADGYKVYEQGNAINDDPYRGKYFVDEKKYQELINFKVLPHDLIVSCSGVTLGRISEIPEDGKAGIINQALLRIRLRKELISNKFFIIHFRAAFFQKKIFDQSQGTAMPNLVGIKDFKEIEMMIPPPEEQEIIVQEIENKLLLCRKIEETVEAALKQSEILRYSILKKAFEGKLVKQNPKDEPAQKLLERIRAEKEKNKPEKKTKLKMEKV